jgi:glycosyltransferase involved in cell wall biosynthesis
MRVAIIHPFLYRYARGIERFTFNLANALARRGIEVHLLTWRWQQPIRIDALDPRVQVHWMPTSRYYAAKAIVPFYAWHLLTHRYDFVWIYFAGYGEAEALTLARRQRFGIVFHYPLIQVPHRYREFQRYGLARRAARIVSVSRYVADGVREFCGRDSMVIYNGVDVSRFNPDPDVRTQHRAELGFEEADYVLLSVAALEERKGIQRVIDALPQVLATHPKTKYIVVGEGPYRSTLEAKIANLGLDAVVKLAGERADIFPYYNGADVFLLLSSGEALPIAPLEAMAMQLPVIAAQQPPFDELLAPEYGVMVNEQDARRVASAINGLLGDDARRHAMGEQGRARILADFTWERVAEQYQKVIE